MMALSERTKMFIEQLQHYTIFQRRRMLQPSIKVAERLPRLAQPYEVKSNCTITGIKYYLPLCKIHLLKAYTLEKEFLDCTI